MKRKASPAKKKKPSAVMAKKAKSRLPRKSTTVVSRAKPKTEKSLSKAIVQFPATFTSGVSLDRKLDIGGVVIILMGLLTLLGMISSKSFLAAAWMILMKATFGWAAYLLPVGLLGVGGWLVLRKFERMPRLAIERLIGVVLLFLNLVVWLHFIVYLWGLPQVLSGGAGGGYFGNLVLRLLVAGLGQWGAVIFLLAWMIIGLALTLDTTVLEMFAWLLVPLEEVKHLWEEYFPSRRRRFPIRPSINTLQQQEDIASFSSGRSVFTQPVQPVQAGAFPTRQELGGPSTPESPLYPWTTPVISEILDSPSEAIESEELNHERAIVIEETLKAFGAPVHVVEINRGPTITQFGVEPDFIETRKGRMRVRVGRIAALADDLALALAAKRIRIQAPVPGKGYVGIEVPNEHPTLVTLRSVIESQNFQKQRSPLRLALGQNVAGEAVTTDLAVLPHLLIAGATGSGKSICINSLICCLLLHNTPADLRLMMVDPKRVELTGYNGVPHLLMPVVVDLEKVVGALQWVMREVDRRYHAFADVGARNIIEFNTHQEKMQKRKEPYLVVIIDELADLMMLAPDETERSLARLSQMARATGIHLVIATQRPSVDVVTGVIKANFPARIAFAVASSVDSRVIIDQTGAERLLGSGDMLFQAPDAPAPQRLQGVYVSDQEIQRVVNYWRNAAFQAVSTMGITSPEGVNTATQALPIGLPLKQIPLWEDVESGGQQDVLLDEAIDLVRRQGRASVSMLQRRLRIGYTRAARLVETMEARGIVGPPAMGTGTREVLDYGDAAPPADEA